jgi:serine/threonine protein kinase
MSLTEQGSLDLRNRALGGAGGMSEAYEARDQRLGRDVAIKVMPASFADPRSCGASSPRHL